MKIVILGGLLGSGKTRVLLQSARYLVEQSISDSQPKVAIIETESAENIISLTVIVFRMDQLVWEEQLLVVLECLEIG